MVLIQLIFKKIRVAKNYYTYKIVFLIRICYIFLANKIFCYTNKPLINNYFVKRTKYFDTEPQKKEIETYFKIKS